MLKTSYTSQILDCLYTLLSLNNHLVRNPSMYPQDSRNVCRDRRAVPTVPIDTILSVKNVRAWVSMDFT